MKHCSTKVPDISGKESKLEHAVPMTVPSARVLTVLSVSQSRPQFDFVRFDPDVQTSDLGVLAKDDLGVLAKDDGSAMSKNSGQLPWGVFATSPSLPLLPPGPAGEPLGLARSKYIALLALAVTDRGPRAGSAFFA